MKVIFMCNGIIVNEHSDGGLYYGWNNPFKDIIPSVGDYVELGESIFKDDNTPMKIYMVQSRKFSAKRDYNSSYTEQVCTVFLSMIKG